VLCLLEGATAEEAARQLDCPLGTVKSRLARGREALRVRLVRRGVAPGIALTAVSTGIESTVSAELVRATAAAGSSRVAPGILAFPKGASPAMFPKSALLALLLVALVSFTGAGMAAYWKTPPRAKSVASRLIAQANLRPVPAKSARPGSPPPQNDSTDLGFL